MKPVLLEKHIWIQWGKKVLKLEIFAQFSNMYEHMLHSFYRS